MSVLLTYMPVRLISGGLNELLEGAPPADLLLRIGEAVERARAEHGLSKPLVRSGKVGRKLYVEVDFTVNGSEWDITAEDAVRRSVERELRALELDVWAYVSLTADPSLFD